MADHRPIEPRHARAVLIIIVAALSGCGGGSSAKPLAEESIATQTRVLREQLVSTGLIASATAGSLRRAFLDYWRSVQFADTEAALGALSPARAMRSERNCSRWRSGPRVTHIAPSSHASTRSGTARMRAWCATSRRRKRAARA